MFGIKSARRRALAASTVMLVLLGMVGGVASWRTHSDRSTLRVADQRVAVVTELDNARAYTLLSTVQFAAAILSDEPISVEATFSKSSPIVDGGLREARANLAAMGDEGDAAKIDGVIAQIDQWETGIDTFVSTSSVTAQDEKLRVAQQYIPSILPQFEGTMSTLEQVSNDQQSATRRGDGCRRAVCRQESGANSWSHGHRLSRGNRDDYAGLLRDPAASSAGTSCERRGDGEHGREGKGGRSSGGRVAGKGAERDGREATAGRRGAHPTRCEG